MARAVRVVSHGRAVLDGGRTVRRAEPGEGEAGKDGGGLAVVQCGRSRVGQDRWDRRDWLAERADRRLGLNGGGGIDALVGEEDHAVAWGKG